VIPPGNRRALGTSGILDLATGPQAVGTARRFVAGICESAHYSELVCETARLLTSEVVSNAVLHGSGDRRIGVTAGPELLRVDVHDGSAALPEHSDEPHPDHENGRGVRLLDELATAWGSHVEAVGKTVWFELQCVEISAG
jgi:anti-sigma regulatory factor (Ser/Thr protein kinase)